MTVELSVGAELSTKAFWAQQAAARAAGLIAIAAQAPAAESITGVGA